MHSSRMRTGRALTIWGGVCIPERFFWGKEIEKKKRKKIFRHPPKISDPPRKFQTPPKNLDTPPGPDPHPPLTHASENITLAQLRCGR